MIDGDPNPNTRRPVKVPKNSGDRAALDLLLSKLNRSESTEVYQEMLAAAEAKIVPRVEQGLDK